MPTGGHESDAPATGPQPLAYAAAPRWHRWARVRRVIGVVVLLCAAAAAVRWLPAAWERAATLHWQSRCLRYAPPPDRVVYDDDPAAAAALLGPGAGGRYVDVEALPAGASLLPAGMRQQQQLAQLLRPRGPTAGHVPARWDAFAAHLSPPPGTPGAFLFMGELTSATGVRRLAVVQRAVGRHRWHPPTFAVIGFDLDAALLEPGTLTTPPRWVPMRQQGLTNHFSGMRPAPPRLRIFAGQADPADASHFTIRYELGGAPGTIDGWLSADGLQLKTAVRDGPAKP